MLIRFFGIFILFFSLNCHSPSDATIEKDNSDLKFRSDEINEARAAGTPTVLSTLALELATNPFLRANLPPVKAAIGMETETDAAAFAEIRKRKDAF